MSKTRMAVCMVVVFAVSLALDSEPISAQGDPAVVVIKLHYRQNPTPRWEIKLQEHKGPDVCRGPGIYSHCDGDEIAWMIKVVPGNVVVPVGSTLTIRPADNAPRCFEWQQADPPESLVITWPETEGTSGSPTVPPHASCPESKHGNLWPYEIVFHRMEDGTLVQMAETDPRGIVH